MTEPETPDPDQPDSPEQPKPAVPEWLEQLDAPAESSPPGENGPIDLGRGAAGVTPTPSEKPRSAADLILPAPPSADSKPPMSNGSLLRSSSELELPPVKPPPPPSQLPKLKWSSDDFVLPTKPGTWPELVVPPKPPTKSPPSPPPPASNDPEPPNAATPKTEPLTGKTLPLPQVPAPKTEPLNTATLRQLPGAPLTLLLNSLTVPADQLPPAPAADDSCFLVEKDDFSGLQLLPPARATRPPEPEAPPPAPASLSELRAMLGGPPSQPAAAAEPIFDTRLPVTYGTVVRNDGSEPMLEVRVEHDVPAGPRYLSSDPPAEVAEGKLVWHLGTIEPGTERRLQVIVLPNNPDEIPDDADGLFQVFQRLTSRSKLLKSNVTVAVQAPESAEVGTPVSLRAEVHNKGNGAARDLQFRIRLPAGIAQTGGDAVDFTVPLLIGGDSKVFETSVTASRPGEYVVPLLLVVADQEREVGRAVFTAIAPAPPPVVPEQRLPQLTLVAPLPEPSLGVADEPHLLFALAGTDYAAPIANVLEVARVPAITPLPRTPAWLLGAAAVGDELVGLIDLRVFLGLPRAEVGSAARVVLVRPRGGEPAAALLVDSVASVRSARPALQGSAGLTGHDEVLPFVTGVAERLGRLLVFLDLDRLLSATESTEPPASPG